MLTPPPNRPKTYISLANRIEPMPPFPTPGELVIICHEFVKAGKFPRLSDLEPFRLLADMFGEDEDGEPRKTPLALFHAMHDELILKPRRELAASRKSIGL
ncbi:hypothetical protein NUL63_004567 [Salmonella enterica]|nr:hypothetical protein [Salmonella enterica]